MNITRKGKSVLILLCIILIMELLTFYTNVKANTYTQTIKVGIENFPEDYKEKLNVLQEMYPNWKFSAFYTGITWNEFIEAETSVHLRNTVIKTSDGLWKDSCEKIASGYSCASKPIICYFADPRNFLNESGIFQFLEMTFNEATQTEESVKGIIKNSFMDKEIPVTIKIGQEEKDATMHYSQIIMEAARESKMSPYSIAIKIIQEVGRQGSSSVSGHYVAADGTVYDGLYNFFNYGAYDTGDAIANGLLYSRDNGWTNPYIAIVEGAKLMANSYTNAGQNTAYFYKWDVVGSSTSDLFWHQYMTNIQDPSSQAKSLYNTYVSNELLSASLSFVIPVFEDMPNINNLPTTIDISLESSYYLIGSDVRVRKEPSTSATILGSLNRDEVVTLLNWDAGTANGYDWAKIRLVNGTEGYIAKIYLKPCNTINNENSNENKENQTNENNDNIDSQLNENNNQDTNFVSNNDKIAKIDGEYIVVNPNRKRQELVGIFNTEEYKIINSDGTEKLPEQSILSGDKLVINERVYKIITFGDANGDGNVNSLDALKILKYDVGATELKDEFLKVTDVNKSGTVDSLDALKILKFDVNLTDIAL